MSHEEAVRLAMGDLRHGGMFPAWSYRAAANPRRSDPVLVAAQVGNLVFNPVIPTTIFPKSLHARPLSPD